MHSSAPWFAAVLLSACTRAAAPPPAPPAPLPLPVASIQELMVSLVDPAADALWESVSSELSANGMEEKHPQTEAEWLAVRHRAIALQEAGTLLLLDGRAVTHGGKPTEDAHVAGVSTPEQIRQAIAANPDGFKQAARELQAAAADALAAIDAKSPARLLLAGGKLDQACEKCHSVYWYPDAKQPPTPWPAALKSN